MSEINDGEGDGSGLRAGSCEELLDRLHSKAIRRSRGIGSWHAASGINPAYLSDREEKTESRSSSVSWSSSVLWDGRYLVVANGSNDELCFDGDAYARQACLRVLDLSRDGPEVVAESVIPDVDGALHVLSDGERLLSIASIAGSTFDEMAPEHAIYTRITPLRLPDLQVAGPSLVVTGVFMEARRVGDSARIALWSRPRIPQSEPDDGAALRNSTIDQWLPVVYDEAGDESLAVDCERTFVDDEDAGLENVSVVTVGMDGSWHDADGVSFFRSPGEFASSSEGVFLGGGQYGYTASLLHWPDGPLPESARIDRFDFEGDAVELAGSVTVPATQLDGASEYDGVLRFFGGQTISAVESGEAFELVGQVESPDVIGFQPFRAPVVGMFDRLVSFEDPRSPAVIETDLTAFPSVSCAFGPNLLVGVRHDATVILVDVSDPTAPTLAHTEEIAGWNETPSGMVTSPSIARPFCWPDVGLMAVPIRVDAGNQNEEGTGWDPTDKKNGFLLYDVFNRRVAGDIVEPRDAHISGEQHALLIGDRIVTVSTNGVTVANVTRPQDVAWVGFP